MTEVLPGEICPTCGHRKTESSFKWNLGNGERSYVPTHKVRFIFQEIVWRIGMSEASRQIPYQRATLRSVLDPDKYHKPFVERRIVERAMVLLKELRKENIVISKDSIKYGAKMRGREIKPPQGRRDFNNTEPEKIYERDTKRKQRAK